MLIVSLYQFYKGAAKMKYIYDFNKTDSSLSYEEISRSVRGCKVRTMALSKGTFELVRSGVEVDKDLMKFTNPPKLSNQHVSKFMY